MRNTLYFTLAFGLAVAGLAAADKPPASAQAERGRSIFMHSTKGTACATCHELAGAGTAIGPDLTNLATYGSVHVLVNTMHMSMTEHVVLLKTADGKFPAILKNKQGEESEYYDLSQMPPVLKKFTAKQIVSSDRDTKWQHPPATVEYTSQELADLVSFLKWAATGTNKEIKPAEVE